MKINANMSIVRNNRDQIRLEVICEDSNTRFLEIHMSPADLALMLTGVSRHEIEAHVAGLDRVGKERVSEHRSIIYPDGAYKPTKELEEWLKVHGQEDGWLVDHYLGSQTSKKSVPEGTLLNYRVYKFIDKEN